jgi:hypothetical protein
MVVPGDAASHPDSVPSSCQNTPMTTGDEPMSKTTTKTRKLTLARETLKTLTPTELSLVAGGGARGTTRCR